MINQINAKLNPEVIKFVGQFIIFVSILYFISVVYESSIPVFSMQSTANVLYLALKTIGIDSVIKGNILTFDAFAIQIVRQCTGIFEVIVLSSVILAYPAPKEKKLAGIVFFTPLIYVINMLRLFTLSMLGIHYPLLFEAVHEYFFQITFVFLVIFLWVFWITKVVKNE